VQEFSLAPQGHPDLSGRRDTCILRCWVGALVDFMFLCYTKVKFKNLPYISNNKSLLSKANINEKQIWEGWPERVDWPNIRIKLESGCFNIAHNLQKKI
jgi:hypothetical protein